MSTSNVKGWKSNILTIAPRNTQPHYTHRVLIGVPTLGIVRIEWHNAMNGVVIPTNFSSSSNTPTAFLTADAQNLLVREALMYKFEWLLLIEDDVIVPPDLFLRFRRHMERRLSPLVSGLYRLKSNHPEPIIYRGRGNGPFTQFKPGQKVWCDGVPTGCLLIHMSVLRALLPYVEEYRLQVNGEIVKLARVFETPRYVFSDPKLKSYQKLVGTSDMYLCDQIMKHKVLAQTEWKRLAKKRYPFIVDTAIDCGHIDRETGEIY